MKKLLLSSLLICELCYAAAPSKLAEKSRFYSRDFKHKSGMKTVSLETQIGIYEDEVFIGRPRVYINSSIVLCECGKEAVNISFKKGDMIATCEEHSEKIDPVNQVEYPVKTAEGINKRSDEFKESKTPVSTKK